MFYDWEISGERIWKLNTKTACV